MWDVLMAILSSVPAILSSIFPLIFGRGRKSIKNDIALVTGSAMGLGREMALKFAKEGCEVICVDLNADENLKTVSMIQDLGGKAKAYVCNVADRKAIMLLAKQVGRVDILVNNAGIYPIRNIWDGTEEEIRTIMDVNILSQIWIIQAFVPGMKERDYGHVVGISSLSAYGLPYVIPYATTKAAIQGLMDSLYEELKLDGSKVNATTVYPYFINTRPEIKECIKVSVPPLETEYVAKLIMKGVLENRKSITVPTIHAYLMSICRLLPQEVYSAIYKENFHGINLPPRDDFAENMKNGIYCKTGKLEKQSYLNNNQ